MRQTLWLDTIQPIPFLSKLPRNHVHILIIGGGMAGISSAYHLKNHDDVMLIEKGQIGHGITARSTAKITFLQQLIYQEIESTYDFERAKKYYQAQKEAIKSIKKTVEKEQIACHFKCVPSITFTTDDKNIPAFQKEIAFLKKVKEPYEVNTSVPYFPSCYALKVFDTAIFHPLEFLYEIASKIKNQVTIVEGVCAYEIKEHKDGYIISTNQGEIHSDIVIVATHYPFFIFPGMIPLKTHIEKDYVACGKGNEELKETFITYEDNPLHSIRSHQDYFIYTGISNLSTKDTNMEYDYKQLSQRYQNFFQNKPTHLWMNHDIVSNDHIPYIGCVKKNLYLATAFGTWGMTNGWFSGMLIKDIIEGKKTAYQSLFQPKRNISLKRSIQFIKDIKNYSQIYGKLILQRKKYLPYYIQIEKKNGITYGVFQDHLGHKHITKLHCPHMKCPLLFNEKERTWDCPCHGSRFDIDGHLLMGPSTDDINL